MKIVCDACQAKYSISDDKVQGKVFKIRCKKCSNIIVVRGGAGAAEPAPQPTQEKETRVYDYGYDGGDQGGGGGGDEAVWHVVINQDQVGPMTAAEVQQRFAGGEIDAETYIWREGFADWLPIAQVDQFAAYVASGSTTAAVGGHGGGGGGAAAVSSMFGGMGGDDAGTVRSDPGDLFAAASASARHADDDGGDLFGSKPASAQASAAASAKLRGERNENSVLFSLNNLAQLASDRPAPVTAAPSGGGGAGHATGAAGGEGSGLIDIRSMANAYLGGPGGAPKTATAGIGSIDDLPVFGGGGFSEPAVIVPTASRGNNSKLMYALIGSVGLLAVAAVILVVVLMSGGNDGKGTQVAANTAGAMDPDKAAAGSDSASGSDTGSATAEPAATGSAGSDDAAAPPETTDSADTAENDAKDEKDDKDDDKDDRPDRADRSDRRPSRRPAASTRDRDRDPKPARTVTRSDSGGGGSCDEVSCVLSNYEGACCAKFKKGGSRPSGGSKASGGGDLPDTLDRRMISTAVAKVKGRVTSCGDKSSAKGEVKVSVKVKPDGGVSSVTIKKSPDDALARCVASAMKRAVFPKTQIGGSFSYPWRF